MSTPEPNSPEAKRAAEKIRNVFYTIAVANLAIVAWAIWPREKSPSSKGPATPPPVAEVPASNERNEAATKGDAEKKPEGGKKDPKKPASAPLPPDEKASLAEMEKLTEGALEGYNKRDAEIFGRGFSASAIPPVNEEFFRTVIIGIYHDEFGELTKMKRTDAETNVDPNLGMIVYEAEGKKRPKVKVSLNFRREDGMLKIVQLRMEKL